MNAWRWTRILGGAAVGLGAAVALGAEEAHTEAPLIDIHSGAIIGNALVTLVIFALVIVILGRFAWRPLLNVLKEREDTIRRSLETAQQEREQAERLLADYQRQLDEARQEATKIVDEGRRDAEALQRRLHDEAVAQAQQLTERARREIRLATDTAVKELYDRTAEVAVQVAGQILNKEISVEQHRQLVADSLAQMRKTADDSMN